MSISRKNWSALSSLTRQWTLEDEEEVERERRRRFRSTSSTADPYDEPSTGVDNAPGDTPIGGSPPAPESTPEKAQSLSSAEQLDFVEMLRARDEKRRVRRAESLKRQKAGEEGEAEDGAGGRAGARRRQLPGDAEGDEQNGRRAEDRRQTAKTLTTTKPTSHAPSAGPVGARGGPGTSSTRENGVGEPTGKEPKHKTSSSSCKFVSAVSISLDKCSSPTERGARSPALTTGSPPPPLSPGSPRASPCHSPHPAGPQSPAYNGYTMEASPNGSPSDDSVTLKYTTRPAFARQSSRTTSFRMLRKKEVDSMPLQRSSSVRMTSQKFESNTDPDQDDEKTPPFQRNTRQRVSSRSIQEKMERLAQAAQKSEVLRSPDVAQRTLFLLDEVSRKRDLFEKDPPALSPTNPGISKQEFRFTSGMSHRINRWMSKSLKSGSSHNATDLRHVDISSKKILFENKQDDASSTSGSAR